MKDKDAKVQVVLFGTWAAQFAGKFKNGDVIIIEDARIGIASYKGVHSWQLFATDDLNIKIGTVEYSFNITNGNNFQIIVDA